MNEQSRLRKRLVAQANYWREYYNPLRGLNIQRVVELLEQGQRGMYPNLMWAYRFAERQDATLRGLVARRTSALLKLNWHVKIKPLPSDIASIERQALTATNKAKKMQGAAGGGRGRMFDLDEGQPQFTNRKPENLVANVDDDGDPIYRTPDAKAYVAKAKKQASKLREVYNGISNLQEAFRHLAMAEFRGFSHCQKIYNADGDLVELDCIPQWYWNRRHMYAPWLFNQSALAAYAGTPITPADFVVREVESPIDIIGLPCFIRKGMSQKDWDAFIEGYGIPPTFIIGPENGADKDKEAEYQNVAENIISDGKGYLPHGSQVQTLDSGARATNPFRLHLDYQNEQLVMAGTGGLLTMLSMPTGIGQGPSEQHADVFNDIAKAEAREISEVFQKQLDAQVLEDCFPDQEALAYFELADQEQTNHAQVIQDVGALHNAGYDIKRDQLEELTGYQFEEAQTPPAPSPFGGFGAQGAFGPHMDEGEGGEGASGASGEEGATGPNEGGRAHPFANRKPGPDNATIGRQLASARAALARANVQDREPLIAALRGALLECDAAMARNDGTAAKAALNRLGEQRVKLLKAVNHNRAAALVMANVVGLAMAEGMAVAAGKK